MRGGGAGCGGGAGGDVSNLITDGHKASSERASMRQISGFMGVQQELPHQHMNIFIQPDSTGQRSISRRSGMESSEGSYVKGSSHPQPAPLWDRVAQSAAATATLLAR